MKFAVIKVVDNSIVQSFDAVPDKVMWPNGNVSHAPSVGVEVFGYRFVKVENSSESPGEFYQSLSASSSLSKGTLTLSPDWKPLPLDSVQVELCRRIDNTAETIRLKYITPGFGQALVYQQKLEEAQRYKLDGKPDPSNYPLLNASGDYISDVCDQVIKASEQWKYVASSIEKSRLSAKKSIQTAKSVDGAVKAYNSVAWP